MVDSVDRPNSCPVLVLGQRGRYVYYRNASGEVIALSSLHHKVEPLEHLFGGDLDWLRQMFPKYEGGTVVGYSLPQLRSWLFQQAREAGIFDPERSVRGPGVWRDDQGGLILHCGDELWHEGRWCPAGERIDGVLYPATIAEPRPAERSAGAEVGRDLLAFIAKWNWLSPLAAGNDHAKLLTSKLFLGFLACGFLAGALKWRPHILVTGAAGTGKSKLAELADRVFCGAMMHTAAPTEAGVRQALRGSARPVMVDEIEHDPLNTRAKQMVELARLGSTDSQGAVMRGSPEGNATGWLIRACFYFSAIRPPVLETQDAARITVLKLGDLPPVQEGDTARVDEGVDHFGREASALYTRVLRGYRRFKENLAVYRMALADQGATSRQCDQLGALLAGAQVLLDDEVVLQEDARDTAALLMPSELVPRQEETGAFQAIQHLLSFPVDIIENTGGRYRASLGFLVDRVRRLGLKEDKRELGSHGLAVQRHLDRPWLVVARQHQGLAKIYHGTAWQNGVWAWEIERLDGALVGMKTVYFYGSAARGVWLPFDQLPALTDPDEAAQSANLANRI